MSFSPVAYAKSHIPPAGPQRTYIVANTIAMMANGAFLPIYILYITQVVGISNSQTAVAATLAALIGLPITMVLGDLADRLGPRKVVLVGLAGQAVGIASYVFISGFWSLLIIGMGMNVFAYAYFSSEGALMRRIGGDETVGFRSQVQVLGSIGVTVGAVVAGVGLTIGTPWAYRSMFLVVAAAYLVTIAVTLRIPDYEPLPKPEATEDGEKPPRWIVLRDKPFIIYALISGSMMVAAFVEHQLLPIWIVVHTAAPRWTVALAFIISTAISITLQMRLSKNIRTTRQGGAALLRYGITLLVGYLVLASMQGRSAWLATVLVIVGVALISIAAIWGMSGRFVLEFTLPPAHAQGQYDGFSNTVMSLSVAAAPLVLIGVVANSGVTGWIGLGLFFLVVGLISPLVAAWGERTRPQAEAEAEAETTTEPDGDAPAGSADSLVANAGVDESR